MKGCLYADKCSFVRKYLNSRELPVLGSTLYLCKEGRMCAIKRYKEKFKKYPGEKLMPEDNRVARYKNAISM